MTTGRWLSAILITAFAVSAFAQEIPKDDSITVDAGQSAGKIKPLQDVDNGPLCQRGAIDLTRYYKALGIRNVRLHDVPWTYDNALDINYVFPNWNADPDRQENYDFTQSDFYIKTITDMGINIIFRLGYSAEYKTPVHHNAPPASYDKWADIAAHIVRHYNDGWDNGQKLGIKYWEIWNEPDNNQFWTGPPEQFDRLYEVTAKTLKRMDPTLKVGGPALAYRLEFLDQFLNYCQAHHVPVDFVSWHIYTQDPNEVSTHAQRIQEMQKQYGFEHSESILDEWNYGPGQWQRLYVDPKFTRAFYDATQNGFGAAFDVAVLTKLQDTSVDIATYYTGTTLAFGMFTSYGAPLKPYYAFLAFRRLLDSPNRIAVDPVADDAVTTLAGISNDGRTVRILMSNRSKRARRLHLKLDGLPWKGPSQCQRQVVDDRYDLQGVGASKKFSSSSLVEELDGQSVLLLTIQPSAQ